MMMSASAFRRSDESHGVRSQSEDRMYGDVLILFFGQSGASHKNEVEFLQRVSASALCVLEQALSCKLSWWSHNVIHPVIRMPEGNH